jgi:hypothetical protein
MITQEEIRKNDQFFVNLTKELLIANGFIFTNKYQAIGAVNGQIYEVLVSNTGDLWRISLHNITLLKSGYSAIEFILKLLNHGNQ